MVFMQQYPPLIVKVWGDLACFTRPEMKVERVSYPAMTPSAARGVLESIFWKPEFAWQVREIHVLRPIRYFSLMRNEVKSKISMATVAKWAESGQGAFYADEDRTQRHTLGVRDVAYLIYADQVLKDHADADPAKYRDQFRRRLTRGQCYRTPYLGCREFAASFGDPDGTEVPIPVDEGLGVMLFDLRYAPDGTGEPVFFPAALHDGILHVPRVLYEEVAAGVPAAPA